jgi:alanine dehydrogenase
MHIGVPKEIKNHEYRVGLTPSSVREIVAHGHSVDVETGAGAGIGATDEAYRAAGAQVASSAEAVFAAADMIVKVKEPQAPERALLRRGQILFTYLHLAPDPEQCADLVRSNAVCIAYETVTQRGGGLPLLAPMSEVSCLAAWPAYPPRRSRSSAPAWSAPMPRRWLSAPVRRWS